MDIKSPFARDALRTAVVMLLIPLVMVFILLQVTGRLVGVQFSWQDWARGVALLLFMYVIVLRIRYQRYYQ